METAKHHIGNRQILNDSEVLLCCNPECLASLFLQKNKKILFVLHLFSNEMALQVHMAEVTFIQAKKKKQKKRKRFPVGKPDLKDFFSAKFQFSLE